MPASNIHGCAAHCRIASSGTRPNPYYTGFYCPPTHRQPELDMPATESSGTAACLAGRIRYIPHSYDGASSEASALQLVTALRPEWKEAGSNVQFVRFTDGITNTLLKAVNLREGLSKEQVDNEAILLRAYGNGTDVLIDRQRETQNHELLMQHGLAPELLARFENGMMYRYLRGKVTKPEQLREPAIYRAVARRLAQWHATVPCLHSPESMTNGAPTEAVNGHRKAGTDTVAPNKPPPNVWTVMQKWLCALPHGTDAERTRQRDLQSEFTWLVQELSQRPGLGKNGVS